MLLYGATESKSAGFFDAWRLQNPDITITGPDYHRLQLEHWLFGYGERLRGKRVMDVGQFTDRRTWAGKGYFTFGHHGCDVTGDLCAIPFPDAELDAVILAEVLEHCADPPGALKEIRRVLKPGGLLLASTPFLWPFHGTDDYPDYWRFTDQGWRLLLHNAGFHPTKIQIFPCEWTKEGAALYDLLRRFECMGMRRLTYATTGLLVEVTA